MTPSTDPDERLSELIIMIERMTEEMHGSD